MDFETCIASHSSVLMEGALGERLKREYGLTINGSVAMADLIYSQQGRVALETLWRGYMEIAEKYNVSINTVKSWKTRYGWQKSVHTNDKKVCTQKRDYSVVRKEAAVTEVEDVLENMDLTDKQQLFCLYFIKCFNATKISNGFISGQ